ncbi:FtsX-like permease family protein [Rhodococcus gannanensis]|uniref:FtsX-like permease family protein n=1 Tax=Rhodococcus gannanensis TaxID=1960308 RepID=A0ABW4NXI4_9NOCA
MFLAVRDLRFATGRFALTIAAGFLVSLMVVLLSGLTAGLGHESISAVQRMGADHYAFAEPGPDQPLSFSDSRVTEAQVGAMASQPGVEEATLVGVAPSRVGVNGTEVGISAFGVDGASFASPVPLDPGRIAMDRAFAEDHGWQVGEQVDVGGRAVTVTALVDNSSYSHQPVVWLDLADWRTLPTAAGSDGTTVALRTSAGFDATATGAATGTAITDESGAFGAIGGYSSERGSLLLMQGMLVVVGSLVVGTFFTVWTIQRGQDLAVLKAVGASTAYLVRDALGQAFAVLVLGTTLGTITAAGLGVLAAQAVPFTLTATGVALPFVALIALGMLGAAAALARIVAVDPLTALGAAR